MRYCTSILLTLCCLNSVFAQEKKTTASPEQAYIRVTNERAGKIVSEMDMEDEAKSKAVQHIIAQQYRDLSQIQDEKEAKIETLKKQQADNAGTDARIKGVEEETDKKIDVLHDHFLEKLSVHLTEKQIDQVKDGMTYNVLPITYKAYLDMIPDLTKEQKKFIKDNLTEAREHAMDAGSSEKKHWWFGKYKGRINNYLSEQGYDLKEEEKKWAERRAGEEDASN